MYLLVNNTVNLKYKKRFIHKILEFQKYDTTFIKLNTKQKIPILKSITNKGRPKRKYIIIKVKCYS